jgi:hypothetical protein
MASKEETRPRHTLKKEFPATSKKSKNLFNNSFIIRNLGAFFCPQPGKKTGLSAPSPRKRPCASCGLSAPIPYAAAAQNQAPELLNSNSGGS